MVENMAKGDLQKVYDGILEACMNIAVHIRYNNSTKLESENQMGDVQLDMDIQTDQLIFEALGKSGVVYSGASEETAEETVISEGGKYVVTWDPLDGSSIIDSNGAIGSIFGIWPKGNLMEMHGRDQVGALLSVYGSRTNCVYYNDVKDRVDEMTLLLESD
jgi:sedoheptulose-bisphosphatase